MAWSLPLIVLWSIVAAFAGWHLAARQGRNAKLWALGTLLLSGLPLIWLVIHGLFAPPSFGTATKHQCCDKQSWTAVADFGHAAGCDFDLGQCENCGSYLMAVFYVASTNYVMISDQQAERFLMLQGTPELKKALKDWFD